MVFTFSLTCGRRSRASTASHLSTNTNATDPVVVKELPSTTGVRSLGQKSHNPVVKADNLTAERRYFRILSRSETFSESVEPVRADARNIQQGDWVKRSTWSTSTYFGTGGRVLYTPYYEDPRELEVHLHQVCDGHDLLQDTLDLIFKRDEEIGSSGEPVRIIWSATNNCKQKLIICEKLVERRFLTTKDHGRELVNLARSLGVIQDLCYCRIQTPSEPSRGFLGVLKPDLS